MQNQSLVKKFLISGAVFAAALGLIAVVMVAMTGTAADTGERLDTRQFPLLERAHRLKLATVQVQQYFTDAAATRGQDGLDDGLRQAETQAQLFRSTVDELAALDPDRAVRYRAMLPDFEAYYAAGRRMAEAYTGSGTAAGNGLMAEFDRTADRLAAQVDPFLAEEQQASHELLQSQANTLNAMRNVIFGVLLVLAPVMGFTALAMLKALRRLPLVEAELRRIAAGDLRGAALPVSGKDEVSAICAGLNAMKSQLQGIMQELTGSATQLATAVQQMGAVSQAANVALDEQQSEVNQVATAMTEMSATAHEVARSAGGAAGSAQEADKASLQGRQAMEDLIAATRALTDDVMRGAELITKLEQESDQIGGIVEVIRSIAEQTNLLALNAAIEAARAGEQGRGFAVVADEVRTLAQRTAKSTSEIQEMIKRLQEGAGKAVAAMEQGRQRSEHNLEQAGRAGERLAGITQAVSNITAMNTQIAAAAEEQSAVAEEMNRNISNISAAATRTTTGARQLADAERELDQLVVKLRGIVGRFAV